MDDGDHSAALTLYMNEVRRRSPHADRWIVRFQTFVRDRSLPPIGRSSNSIDIMFRSSLGAFPFAQMRLNITNVSIEVPFDRWRRFPAFKNESTIQRLRDELSICGFPTDKLRSVPSLRLDDFTPEREDRFMEFIDHVLVMARKIKT
jgi:hypothetical protein